MFDNFFLPKLSSNLSAAVKRNHDFRRVLHTGERTQVVAMALPPGVDIGAETHRRVEQLLFIQSGHGEAVLNGKIETLVPGDVVVVPAGTKHNVINTGHVPLKLFTIYSPPNHIDGRVHATRAAADADNEDEEFGQSVGG